MKHTLPATKVRAQFFSLIEDTDHPGKFLTVTVGGEPKVVMMSAADFEGWQETLEIMADKELMQDIREAMKEVNSGKLVSHEEVKKMLKL